MDETVLMDVDMSKPPKPKPPTPFQTSKERSAPPEISLPAVQSRMKDQLRTAKTTVSLT